MPPHLNPPNPIQVHLEESFWATLLLTAHQLYRFAYDDGVEKSLECLGVCWGTRQGRNFRLRYAAATQIVEHRDENSVQGHDALNFHTHVAWSGIEVGDLNAIGEFHSHPYSEAEAHNFQVAGRADDMWTASEGDCSVMAHDMVEVIVCLQPLTTVLEPHLWVKRGLIVAGRHDLAFVTISAWYKEDDGQVSQAEVHLDSIESINDRLRAYDQRSQNG
jgi:proteasome lid subunit RPN8/RPN11